MLNLFLQVNCIVLLIFGDTNSIIDLFLWIKPHCFIDVVIKQHNLKANKDIKLIYNTSHCEKCIIQAVIEIIGKLHVLQK